MELNPKNVVVLNKQSRFSPPFQLNTPIDVLGPLDVVEAAGGGLQTSHPAVARFLFHSICVGGGAILLQTRCRDETQLNRSVSVSPLIIGRCRLSWTRFVGLSVCLLVLSVFHPHLVAMVH